MMEQEEMMPRRHPGPNVDARQPTHRVSSEALKENVAQDSYAQSSNETDTPDNDTKPSKKVKPTFMTIPRELQLEILSYIPPLMHISLCTTTSHPARDGSDIKVLLHNAEEWHLFLRWSSVSKEFSMLLADATETELRQKRMQLVFDTGATDLFQAEDSGYVPCPRPVCAVEVSRARLKAFSSIKVLSGHMIGLPGSQLHPGIPPPFHSSIKILETTFDKVGTDSSAAWSKAHTVWLTVTRPPSYRTGIALEEAFDALATRLRTLGAQGSLVGTTDSCVFFANVHFAVMNTTGDDLAPPFQTMDRVILNMEVREVLMSKHNQLQKDQMVGGWHGEAANRNKYIDPEVLLELAQRQRKSAPQTMSKAAATQSH